MGNAASASATGPEASEDNSKPKSWAVQVCEFFRDHGLIEWVKPLLCCQWHARLATIERHSTIFRSHIGLQRLPLSQAKNASAFRWRGAARNKVCASLPASLRPFPRRH
jgi:hypothetical protein